MVEEEDGKKDDLRSQLGAAVFSLTSLSTAGLNLHNFQLHCGPASCCKKLDWDVQNINDFADLNMNNKRRQSNIAVLSMIRA